MRRRPSPENRYIPQGYTIVVRSKAAPAVVYLSAEGRPAAMGFYGKAERPAFHHTYRSEERRAQHVAQFLASCEALDKRREERRAQRKAFAHTLQVGDVLSTCWGYDQTNVEFFQVVRLIGASMVAVRELARETEETGFMSGKCVPVLGKFIGPELRKRVLEGNRLDIHGGFGYATKVEMREVAPGVKVADASHWSSYA